MVGLEVLRGIVRTIKGSNEQQSFVRTPVRTSQDERQVTNGNGMGRAKRGNTCNDILNPEIGNLIQPSLWGTLKEGFTKCLT